MGTVVLSIDAELGWGFHDEPTPPAERLAAARSGWDRLLALLEEYEVPATWAVVGHLFLEDCDGTHADLPTPPGWFDHEREPDRWERDLRFGPDLVAAVLGSPVAHEVGCHTFSHVEFGDPSVGQDLARAEIAASLSAAGEWDVTLDSAVYPRNNVGHRAVLAAFGLRCYRGVRPDTRSGAVGTLGKLARATVTAGSPPLVEPTVDEFGLVNVPASLYLFGFEGLGRDLVTPVWGDPVVRQARRGIDRVARRDGVFHMWLLPNNLVGQRDVRRLRAVLEYLDRRRADGDVRVRTMRGVADTVHGERQPQVARRVV